MPILRSSIHLLTLGLLPIALACTDQELTDPSGSTVEITVSTVGEEPDVDGYTIQVDGEPARPIEHRILAQHIAPGDHTIYLGAIAENCVVSGGNPRTVQIPPEGTIILLEVVCTARTGNLLVRTRTQGPLPYPNGLSIAIDEAEGATLDTGLVLISGVARGLHFVELRGITEHCSVNGNPRGVTVRPGETAIVEFPVLCIAPRGTLQITTEPLGQWNPNGYLFSLDGGRVHRIGTSAMLTVDDVPAGYHQVELLDIPRNCSVIGRNPVTVYLSAGTRESIEFKVFCDLYQPGSIRVTVSTAGISGEPSYKLLVNGSLEYQVSPNGGITIRDLQPDTYIVQLIYSPGCRVDGGTLRNVGVRPGVATELVYTVTCPGGG